MACREIPGRSGKIDEIKIWDLAIQLYHVVYVFGNDGCRRGIFNAGVSSSLSWQATPRKTISDEWL
jgi:hypothetical protein